MAAKWEHMCLPYFASLPGQEKGNTDELTQCGAALFLRKDRYVAPVVTTLLGNAVACKVSSLPWARRAATRLAGVALIGVGVKLAIHNR